MKARLLLLLWCLLVLPLRAQTPGSPPPPPKAASSDPVTITAQGDKTVLEIGQSLRVQVEITYAEGAELKPISPEKWDLKPFELQDAALARLPEETPGEGKPTRQRVRYTLRVSGFEEGEQQFPALTLDYSKDGEPHQAVSEPFRVFLKRVTPGKDDKPDEIRDLKPMSDAPFPPLLIALVAVALLLALWLLWRLFKWLRRPKAKPAEPALPPFEWARRELARIEREKVWEAGKFELYYDELTLVLRQYLGWRLNTALLEKTTSETLDALKDRPGLGYESWRELRTILEEADLVKFARLHPPAEKAVGHLLMANQLVGQLAPPPPVAGAAPGVRREEKAS